MFRELVAFLSPSITSLMPRASTALRHWIVNEYETQKKIVVPSPKRAVPSYICLSMCGQLAIGSALPVSRDTGSIRQRKTLAFGRLNGSHSGEN
jgi:hypothetical protein